jgi:hypothetical protein
MPNALMSAADECGKKPLCPVQKTFGIKNPDKAASPSVFFLALGKEITFFSTLQTFLLCRHNMG